MDLDDTVTYIADQAAQLPQLHSDLWELFTEVKGSSDPEAYEEHLAMRTCETDSTNASACSRARSPWHCHPAIPGRNASQETIERYKKDLKFFQNLRAAVTIRYQEAVDFSEYEPRIKKLIDTHVGAGEVEQLCEPINLFDAR